MAETREPLSRRNWLLHGLQVSIAATLAAIFYPVVRFVRPRSATSSGALEVVAPYRVNELKPDAQGHWPPPFNFGGKPCLVIRTPEGKSPGLQRGLHPLGMHRRVPRGPGRTSSAIATTACTT